MRYFLAPPDHPLMELVAVEPMAWELVLLRDMNHDVEDVSIYRILVTNQHPEAPETAGRKRAVLRVTHPNDERKMLLELDTVPLPGSIGIVDSTSGEIEVYTSEGVTLFRPPPRDQVGFHTRKTDMDA